MSFTGISLGVGGGSDCVSVRGLGGYFGEFFRWGFIGHFQ